MDDKTIKNKVHFELLLDELITDEKTEEATQLKKELIMDLMNKKMDFINVISYYYEIIKLNENSE